MDRSPTVPEVAFRTVLQRQANRLTQLERRAMWPGATQYASYEGPESTTFFQMPAGDSGYPWGAAMLLCSADIGPGRWVVTYEAALAASGSDTAYLGVIADVGFASKIQQRFIANFPIPRIDFPSTFRLANEVVVPEIFAPQQARLLVFTGGSSFPGDPDVAGTVFSASLVAIPG